MQPNCVVINYDCIVDVAIDFIEIWISILMMTKCITFESIIYIKTSYTRYITNWTTFHHFLIQNFLSLFLTGNEKLWRTMSCIILQREWTYNITILGRIMGCRLLCQLPLYGKLYIKLMPWHFQFLCLCWCVGDCPILLAQNCINIEIIKRRHRHRRLFASHFKWTTVFTLYIF